MLEPEDIKKMIKSVKTFDNTKNALEESDKSFFGDLFEFVLKKTEKALEKVFAVPTGIDYVNVEIINAGLLSETLTQDILLNSNLTTMLIDKDAVRKCSTIITEEMITDDELTSKEIATFNEVLDQMMISFTKNLTNHFGYTVNYELQAEKESEMLSQENLLQIAFSLKVSNVDTTIYYLMSYDILNEIITLLSSKVKGNEEENNSNSEELEESVATVQPIKFEEFSDVVLGSEKENMELLKDLQLQVSVELGKVKKPIKEILQFTQGTIVELDRLAGENVDVLVSGKIIAKGEVVVVDQNFGVRITQIVIPEKRV